MTGQALGGQVDDVARAIIDELGALEAMKLQKLLYLAQGWFLAITNRPMFQEVVEAWRDGPVVDEAYQKHKLSRTVAAWPWGEAEQLGRDERQVVSLVCGQYGDLSGDDLSTLTHQQTPWKATRAGLAPNMGSKRPISHKLMRDYFLGKQLGGRSTADLAAGGLMLIDRTLTTEQHRARLDDVKADFVAAAKPANVELPLSGISGRASVPLPPEVSQRVAELRARRARRQG